MAAWAAAGDGSAVPLVDERQWRCDGGSSGADGMDAAACGRAEAGGRCCVGAAKTTPGDAAAAAAVAGCGEPLLPAAVGPEKGRAVGVAAAAVTGQMPECARCCWPPGHGSDGGGDSAAAVAVDDHHRPDPPSDSDRSWLAAVAAAAAVAAIDDDDWCGPWRRRWEAADG